MTPFSTDVGSRTVLYSVLGMRQGLQNHEFMKMTTGTRTGTGNILIFCGGACKQHEGTLTQDVERGKGACWDVVND